MSARILYGKEFAAKIKESARTEVEQLKSTFGVTPGLAVIIVGENPASQVYVRNKHKTCAELGILSEVIALPEDTTKDALLARIDALNADKNIHGILVQLPLPAAIKAHSEEILNRIDPRKDVDGFHPVNVAIFSRKTHHQVNFFIGVAAANFFQVSNVAPVHSDYVIKIFIICVSELFCSALSERNMIFEKFVRRAEMHLCTDRSMTARRLDGNFFTHARLFDKIFHDKFSHRRAANISPTDKIYFQDSVLPICFF